MSKTLYHYTSMYHLAKIIDSGYLKLTPSNLKMPTRSWVEDRCLKTDTDDYKPVVWASDTLDFKAYDYGLDGSAVDKTEVVIAILDTSSFHHWGTWADKNRMDKRYRKILTQGRAWNRWFVSEIPIPLGNCRVMYRDEYLSGNENWKEITK